jgi:hypothetical protein
MVAVLARYRVDRVIGDNYSAEWVKQAFESRGVRYEKATTNPWSNNPTAKVAKNKSQLYLELLPRLCSGEIELLDNEVLISQLANLERRTRSGGRDIIDHVPGSHDDVANVGAGVADAALQQPIVLAPLFGPGVAGNSFMSEFEYHKSVYEREQQRMSQPDRDDEPWRDLMKFVGRAKREPKDLFRFINPY